MKRLQDWSRRRDLYNAYGSGYRYLARTFIRFGPGHTDADYDFQEVWCESAMAAEMTLQEQAMEGYCGYTAEILPGGWLKVMNKLPEDLTVVVKEKE